MTSHKILASVIAVAIIASAIGIYELKPYDTTTFFLNEAGVKYHGHVQYVVKDQNGNIKGVYQSDNTRTVQGINCAEQFIFNGLSTGVLNTNGTNVCGFQPGGGTITSAKFNGFRFIGLINQSATGANGNNIILNGSDTVATSKIGGTRVQGNHGIVFTSGQGLPVNSTVAGTSTYNQITITSSAIPFTGIGPSGTNICGAALLNSTSSTANALFAENKFSCITLASSDTLTITWTITLS